MKDNSTHTVTVTASVTSPVASPAPSSPHKSSAVILELQNEIHELEECIACVASDIEDIVEKRAVLRYQYGAKEDEWRYGRMNKIDQRWIKHRSTQRTMKPHEYAEIMQRIQDKQNPIPNMVLRQQIDLCQKLHQADIVVMDAARVKQQHVDLMTILEEQKKEMKEEKMKMEFEFTNRMCQAEAAWSDMKLKYDALMEETKILFPHKEENEKESTGTVTTHPSMDDDGCCDDELHDATSAVVETTSPSATRAPNMIRRRLRTMIGNFRRPSSNTSSTISHTNGSHNNDDSTHNNNDDSFQEKDEPDEDVEQETVVAESTNKIGNDANDDHSQVVNVCNAMMESTPNPLQPSVVTSS